MNDDSINIVKVKELLTYKLEIPTYQRPYKWTTRNIVDLLTDIEEAMYQTYDNYLYRIGTVILFDNREKGVFEIIDGQQRLISLLLIAMRLDAKVDCSLLKCNFTSKISQNNINLNYKYINNWFNLKEKSYIEKFRNYFNNNLEFVLLKVTDISQAFQLFDSQNNRGKELDPHDLLKAYHLREILTIHDKKDAVTKWENKRPMDIRNLYSIYLFPIINWSRKTKAMTFSSKYLYEFKGVKKESKYNFAKRVKKIVNHYQITLPFVAGIGFFGYTDCYLNRTKRIEDIIKTEFPRLYTIIDNAEYNKSIGFRYAKNLFYAAMLCYYDRFNNYDANAVINIFTWAFMLRVDIINLGFDSINKYAIGEEGWRYSNYIPMFSIICNSYDHNEISRLNVKIEKPERNNWGKLYEELLAINKGEITWVRDIVQLS